VRVAERKTKEKEGKRLLTKVIKNVKEEIVKDRGKGIQRAVSY
jgi:hypothetical protein